MYTIPNGEPSHKYGNMLLCGATGPSTKGEGAFLPTIITILLIVLLVLFARFGNNYYSRVGVIRRFFKNKGMPPYSYLERTGCVHNIDYASVFANGTLDLYTANDATRLQPLILWVHGGGYVGGDKSCVKPWAHVLAADVRAAVVSINYCLAPEQHYPGPLLQIGEALTFLQNNAQRFGIDTSRIFLGGDSAGAQIVSQYAALVCNADLQARLKIVPAITREQLRGLLLCCGFYDMDTVLSARFPAMKTFLWAYTDQKKLDKFARKDELSTVRHISPDYCDTFVTCGKSDPFLKQAYALTDALQKANVATETYFPAQKNTGHEYQFLLDTPAGKTAVQKAVEFIEKRL